VIEHLTDEITEPARWLHQKIDDMGGALAAIEKGYLQNEIQEAAYQLPARLESKEQMVVGVNAFQTQETLQLERSRWTRLSSRSRWPAGRAALSSAMARSG
jgi:methylmalonyl-CoA mutase, N-terminal domain